MIIPSILPDEQDRGYLGKLMRCNGAASKTKMVQQLLEWTRLPREVPLVLPIQSAWRFSMRQSAVAITHPALSMVSIRTVNPHK